MIERDKPSGYSELTDNQKNAKYKATKEWRDRNKDHVRRMNRERRQSARNRVLQYYGNQCELCSNTDKEVLVIDHIWVDGSEHRKQVPANRIYDWLLKNKFPPGYRLLCHNCNYKAFQAHKESKFPPMALVTLQREICQWANQNFPDRDATSVWNKLGEELKEWADNPDDASELADCLILILDWCHLKGVNAQEMINRKMNININRKWIFDPTRRIWNHDKTDGGTNRDSNREVLERYVAVGK